MLRRHSCQCRIVYPVVEGGIHVARRVTVAGLRRGPDVADGAVVGQRFEAVRRVALAAGRPFVPHRAVVSGEVFLLGDGRRRGVQRGGRPRSVRPGRPAGQVVPEKQTRETAWLQQTLQFQGSDARSIGCDMSAGLE